MSDILKVTKEMVEGKKKPPAGYELRNIKHNEYGYTHPASGKKVVVKAHMEHVLFPIKKADSKEAVPKKVASKKAALKTKPKEKDKLVEPIEPIEPAQG